VCMRKWSVARVHPLTSCPLAAGALATAVEKHRPFFLCVFWNACQVLALVHVQGWDSAGWRGVVVAEHRDANAQGCARLKDAACKGAGAGVVTLMSCLDAAPGPCMQAPILLLCLKWRSIYDAIEISYYSAYNFGYQFSLSSMLLKHAQSHLDIW